MPDSAKEAVQQYMDYFTQRPYIFEWGDAYLNGRDEAVKQMRVRNHDKEGKRAKSAGLPATNTGDVQGQ